MAYSSVKKFSRSLRGLRWAIEKSSLDLRIGELFEFKWRKAIDKIMKCERTFDAVVIFNIPIRPMMKVFDYVKRNYGLDLFYYDGDIPEVLPEFGTFGYNYYNDVDLSTFSGFISNSEGVNARLSEMGAKHITTIHYGIDPEIYHPYPVDKKFDIMFSGSGTRGREEWIRKMVIEPAELSLFHYAVSGRLPLFSGKITNLGFLHYSEWLRRVSSSHINLNISRYAHSSVSGTSTYRIFELCGTASAVITNPHKGIEKWYTPGKEIYVLSDDENPTDVYKAMLSDKDSLLIMGSLARKKTLEKHTCENRAQSMLDYVSSII